MTALAALLAHWEERDGRYAVRRNHGHVSPLSDGEQASIRAYRATEVERLPVRDRPTASVVLSSWTAPVIRELDH